jgi:hypothetical protein
MATTSFVNLRPFFGTIENTPGEQLCHLNYVGSNFRVAINAGNVNHIETQPVLQFMLAENHVGSDPKESKFLHESIIDLVCNTAKFHHLVENGAYGGSPQSINKSPAADWLVNSVYKNWATLSSDVRAFYSEHMHMLQQNKDGKWNSPRQPIDKIVSNPSMLGIVRLNLTKANAVKENPILFATTLPRLPKSVEGFRVTTTSGVQKYPFSGNVPETFLQDVYMSVFKSGTGFNYGTMTITTPDWSGTKVVSTLDTKKFMRNALIAHSKVVARSPYSGEANLDDVFESIVTGRVYTKKDDGKLYVRDGSGPETLYEDGELEALGENCFTTGIKDDGTGCGTVFQCLLSGRPENLSRCLDNLKNQDMYKVAQSEVEKMQPRIAVQLLKTFGFAPRKELPSGQYLPPSFSEWTSKILPRSVDEATKKAIMENKPLMDYLKAVVNLVRNNPAIISENRQVLAPSGFAKKAELAVFVQPTTSAARSKLNTTILEQGVLMTQPSLNQMFPLAGMLPNLGLGRGGMFNPSIQLIGGGSSDQTCINANTLKDMFSVTYAEMERNGKVLVDEDKQKIDAAVQKVANLEKQLIRILEDFKLFSKLNSALSVGGTISVDPVTLKEVVSCAENQVSTEAMNNLSSCASQNIGEQSQIIHDLFFKVQRSLVELMANGQSGNLSQAR